MSRSDAEITVSCDECGDAEVVLLCALAGGGWDERYVEDLLTRDGWSFNDGVELCPGCTDKAKESQARQRALVDAE